jgi:hypothetical protein
MGWIRNYLKGQMFDATVYFQMPWDLFFSELV